MSRMAMKISKMLGIRMFKQVLINEGDELVSKSSIGTILLQLFKPVATGRSIFDGINVHNRIIALRDGRKLNARADELVLKDIWDI